jgi:hypothetical protein
MSQQRFPVYLEAGEKRVFAGSIDWPGWCRSGKNDETALRALLSYAPRYAAALHRERVNFMAPARREDFLLAERLKGNATTDFGAPAIPPSLDAEPAGETQMEFFRSIVKACWKAFDLAVREAGGTDLLRGPRGGGRDLDEIVAHVADAELAYVGKFGAKVPPGPDRSALETLAIVRQTTLDLLRATEDSPSAERGPRGGVRWTLRYFVRRAAWHVLDHAWEIEDRNPHSGSALSP